MTNDKSLQKSPDDLLKIFEAMEFITVNELKSLKEKDDENPIEPDDNYDKLLSFFRSAKKW